MKTKAAAMKMTLIAAAASLAFASGTVAAAKDRKAKTPDGWAYTLKNGKPVPKMQRKVNADGSWTEELRQGNCLVTRHGKKGEFHETRKCD